MRGARFFYSPGWLVKIKKFGGCAGLKKMTLNVGGIYKKKLGSIKYLHGSDGF